jgi:predicted DNA binding CopG/RHH family protein
MKMNKTFEKIYLDKQEKDLAESLKTIDLKSIPAPSQKKQESFKKAASNFLRQESKTSIQINSIELGQIKKRADSEGVKYQSFIKNIIHKYVTGQLVEAKLANN